MLQRPAVRTGTATALAGAGVVLGHALTYAGLAPRALAREAWLAATGHAYLPVVARPLFMVAMLAFGAIALRGLGPGGVSTTGGLTRRLVILQLCGFTTIEVLERLASGSSFHDLLRVLPVGLSIQAAIAFAVAALVRTLLRAVRVAAAGGGSDAVRPRAALTSLALPPMPAIGTAVPIPVGGRAPPIAS